jgi:L-galactose dehydrogenase/L-glyceraldehyde 3-phosphate reductase
MELRTLGRTGLRVSALGFGCGNVGGLMIRGAPAERERAVARALELGINYFDTAPSYGDGESERNLGQALRALKVSPYVGTKFRLEPSDAGDVAGAISRSLETSLRLLQMERVDLFQLHNPVGLRAQDGVLGADAVLDKVVPALERLQRQGKTRFYGITATGETEALHQVIEGGVLHTAQVFYNLLNPSAGTAVPDGFPGQDFHRLLGRTRDFQMGVIVVRALAGGALSGEAARHPVAIPTVEPIATGPDYATDVGRARQLRALVEEGHAADLVEAALRFPLASDAVSTVLLGYSSLDQLEHAAAAVKKGPLPASALDRLSALWRGFAPRGTQRG